MLAAFLWYRAQCSESERRELECLYRIDHRDPYTSLNDGMPVGHQRIEGVVPSILCTAEGCERCTTLRGGYQFRWCSLKWMDKYREFVELRKGNPRNEQDEYIRNIWMPGDAENCGDEATTSTKRFKRRRP